VVSVEKWFGGIPDKRQHVAKKKGGGMKKLLTILCGISLAIMISANASALQLIENGGFDEFFKGWDVQNSSIEGGWTINFGSLDPEGPGGKLEPIIPLFDAKTDSPAAGNYRLSQTFEIPTGTITSATLSWSDRIENYGTSFIDPDQEFRVDIFSDTDVLLKEIFSTEPGDDFIQIGPNFRSSDSNDDPDYLLAIDLVSILQPFAGTGQSLALSFLQVNKDFFNVTVDDISLVVEFGAAPVPEPATILLLSIGLMGFVCYGRKRRQYK